MVCCGIKRPIISLKNCFLCSEWFWYLKVKTILFNSFNTLTLSYSLKSHVKFLGYSYSSVWCLFQVFTVHLSIHIHLIQPPFIYKPKKLTVFTQHHFHLLSCFFLRQIKTTLKRMYFVRCLKDLNECLFNKMPIIYFSSCSLSFHCCSKIQHSEDFTWPNCTLTVC